MKAGTEMPAIDEVTIGMAPENCMAYCHKHPKKYKYFGEEKLLMSVGHRHRKESKSLWHETLNGCDLVHEHQIGMHNNEPQCHLSIFPTGRSRTTGTGHCPSVAKVRTFS